MDRNLGYVVFTSNKNIDIVLNHLKLFYGADIVQKENTKDNRIMIIYVLSFNNKLCIEEWNHEWINFFKLYATRTTTTTVIY